MGINDKQMRNVSRELENPKKFNFYI
jgi:hypothetical protein